MESDNKRVFQRKLKPATNWGNLEICLNPRMCEFPIQYRQNISTFWLPREDFVKPQPPWPIQCGKLYYTHIGMVPHYTGHIPQYQFRCGATFGELSKNVLGK
ncbi:hypothetical protein O3M35_003274 [Rhynocoris fuscipes]|uniref:Ciliary microtubule inner protein 2A-C-like domain-containing protein n=1 Tax=Rhynocoris fuscipes TaxID=488301 RepID=A0AAW1CLW6_9HEMI